MSPTVEREPLVLSTLTTEKKRVFLQAMRDTGGNVSRSAEIVGVSRQNAYQWRDYDRQFALDWDDCLEFGTEHLEEKLYARACEVDTTAAIFLLKARRPDKYRETYKVETEMNVDTDRLAESLMNACLEAARRRAEAQALPAASTPDSE